MKASIALTLALATAVAGCSFLPYNLSDEEWAALTPQQKVELRRQWYVTEFHPAAAVLSPAYMTPISVAGTQAIIEQNASLTKENQALKDKLATSDKKLADTSKEISRLRTQITGAAYILDTGEPPLPKAAPNPAVTSTAMKGNAKKPVFEAEKTAGGGTP